MFSTQHDTDEVYDFTKHENALRWRSIFVPSLKKVLEQVHPRLTAKEDAFLFVEKLCIRILSMLCGKPLPHSIQEIEEKIKKCFPAPIDYWALNEAKETINTKKRKLLMPVDRVHSLLQKDVLQYKIDISVTIFIVAVLEYISADILKLAGNYVRKIKNSEITTEDVQVAMCADKVLTDMFHQNDLRNIVLPNPTLPTQFCCTTYEEVVKELIHEEKQYQRDLDMIIRVFREQLAKIADNTNYLDSIFSNIFDIYEVTMTLLGSLEDVIEMSQEQNTPYIGSCFEELAEAEEFHVYTKYAEDVTSLQSQEALAALLLKSDGYSLISVGHGFPDAVKYYLPKLLLVPVWHAFLYFDYIKLLMGLSPLQEDIESFEQVQGLLRPLRCDLENIVNNLPKEICIPLSNRARRQAAVERTKELQNTVENWDKDVGQNCNEFIREDSLGKLSSGKRIAERKVYLFDGLIFLCKPNTKKVTATSGIPAYDFKLKEKFFIRRVEIIDRDDTDELKHTFEIAARVQPPVILTAKNSQHKNDWMADLIMVNKRSMLDKILDSILLDIEKKHPLRMPTADIYYFTVPDSPDNIVLEEKESVSIPLIKGATLYKLIERLTYHIYADPMFVRTFLTTYRYFCSPQNLLTLLIERFNIPEPSLVYKDNHHELNKELIDCETEKIYKNAQREDWNRYRKEYVQPVQFRVLNVLRHWVDHHFYDFEKEPFLLERLLHFLENVSGKSMRKWVDSVLKILHRKKEQEISHKLITFAYGNSPPSIEHHLNLSEMNTNLLTLHPLELARQLTLLEFELYKNVKPSELVGSPWTKKDKHIKSPNLLKIMKHTTNVTRWIEKSIIESENYEERVAMVTRAIEVMMVMLELNNFNGILSISAAMGSASVYRLKLTFQGLPARYEKFLEECRELNDGHLKKYQEKLRSINPPCVPFFGRYLTNILHLEEGNPDFLPNTELINFSKRRKVAEIIGEIQQYQNQPYCLLVDAKIRNFLEDLDPFKGMTDTDISNLLYHESLRIEPRGCKQPPKFPRKWAWINLKSPGIKPRRQTSNSCGISLIQNSISFGVKALNPMQNDGEQSPLDCSNISTFNLSSNTQIYSIFANVDIPERNRILQNSHEVLAKCSSTSTILVNKNDIDFAVEPTSSTVSTKGTIANSSDTKMEKSVKIITSNAPPFQKESIWNIENGRFECANLISFNENKPSSSIKLHISPGQEGISSSHTTLLENMDQYFICRNEDSLCASDLYSVTISPQFNEINTTTEVPYSPHVNVSLEGAEYRSIIPPPLPPRKKELTESCIHLAQKRQTQDAPLLPPRDDEISPPPVPPRLNNSFSAYLRSQHIELTGKNSLLQPNTSSIMIRRNSALNKSSVSLTPMSSNVSRASSHFNKIKLPNNIQNTQNIPTSYTTSESLPCFETSCCTNHQVTDYSKGQSPNFTEFNAFADSSPQLLSKSSICDCYESEKSAVFLYPSRDQE